MQCKDSNSNCLLLSLDPSSCKCTSFCVVQSIFFVLHEFSFVVFTHSTQSERERERERKRQRSCKACYVFNLSTICKRCTIQGSQLSLVPPSSIPVLTKFTVSFTVLHVVYWGHCMNLPKNREKQE